MDNITTRLVARLLSDARLHVYPDGHLGLLTMADDLALVSAFLGSRSIATRGSALTARQPRSTTPGHESFPMCREGHAMVNPLATLGRDKLRIEKLENVAVPPNTERTLCNKTGPGVVRSLWMALGGGGAPALDGRLRVYYDGSPTAAIDIDMGTLLATHWGAGSANTSHSCQHVHVEIDSGSFGTAFLLTFPMPFGSSIRIAYFNIDAGQTATVYSMTTYALTSTDEAGGQRLRCQGVRYVDQKVTRTASSTTTLATITGGPGSIVYHSYVGGVGATNLSWLERNFSVTVDGEATPQIVATGTEDWFDSGWYFYGRRDYNTSFHSYVGTDRPAGNVNTVAMATDLWSKWGGVPFTTSAVVRSLPEAGCTTGDTLCWCILYYQ